uniref:Uncharacterized protein n=1 Tax=Cacopsylla melanoneura TaxID=428564 RepID=A0A8D8SAR5_9HEMI
MSKYNLNSLEHRRNIADIIFVTKIMHSLINCEDLKCLLTFNRKIKNTRNKDLFKLKTYKTNIAQNNPINRCMSLCNTLCNPPHNIDFESVSISQIKNYLLGRSTLH